MQDQEDRVYPLPIVTSFVAGHAPQPEVVKFHPVSLLKGWLPHAHIIAEEWTFEQKQALGKHMELYHKPDQSPTVKLAG